MSNKKLEELSKIIGKFIENGEITIPEIQAFMMTTFIQTSILMGYPQDFFNKKCDELKILFSEEKQRLK